MGYVWGRMTAAPLSTVMQGLGAVECIDQDTRGPVCARSIPEPWRRVRESETQESTEYAWQGLEVER